jgi:hypothetical protein
MEINPEQSTVGEVASDIEETVAAVAAVEAVAAPKKVRKTAAKAVPTRKTASKPASRSKPKTKPRKRRTQAAKPVAPPPPPPLTIKELKEQGAQAKQELVNAVIEPALEAAGSLSQTIRDTIGGAFAGLLSRKRRGD